MGLMITSLTSLVVAGFAFSFYERQRYKKFKEAELVQIVDLLGPQSRRYIMDGDRQQAESWLSMLTERQNVRTGAIYDAHGMFFAGYQRDSSIQAPPRSVEDIQEACFTDNSCTSLQGLYNEDIPEGFFFLAIDLDDAQSGLLSIIAIFCLVTVFTLALAYHGALFLYDQFKKPIVSLVDTARFICEKKDFKARATMYSSDEMGLLTRTINSMLDEISKREEEMKDLTDQLESRVETRTAALQEINARLYSEKTRADKAATVKNDFLANMSHEIRTPMNGIVAACDLAMEEEITPKVGNYLKIIQDSSNTLLIIINDILDFSRLQAGTLVLNHSLFSLPDLFEEINDLFSVKAHDENIDLVIDMDADVPVLLMGDRLRLRQILYNLVDNGIKFTQNGMVSLYASCLDIRGEVASLEMRVRDTGVGLSAEGKERIFSSFHQEDSSITRLFGGTGLGLPISRKLARMMGGNINVESEPGKGSTFIVTVRLGWQESDIDESVQQLAQENNNVDNISDLSGRHILVVEDDKTNRGIAEAMLTAMDITVESVANGKEAVDITRDSYYDVILMDIQMPIMDGYQAMGIIRQQGVCKNVPIIAMTAHALTEDKEKCLQAGANAYISKPVHKQQLQTVLATVLSDNVSLGAGVVVNKTLLEDPKTGSEFIPQSCLIDVAKAIRQLGVRDDVYHRVLRTFCHDYKGFRENYTEYSRANDFAGIQKMIHSLKGSSATVGAEILSKLAIEADQACKNKEMPSDILAEKIITCLEEVLVFAQEIDKKEGGIILEPDELSVKDPGEVMQQLQDLADSLDQSMYDTINLCLERLQENVSGKRIVSLHKMIRTYSYEDALTLVGELAKELALSLRK